MQISNEVLVFIVTQGLYLLPLNLKFLDKN